MGNELAVRKMELSANNMKVSPEEYKEQMAGLPVDLDKIDFPSGKSITYNVPDGNGGFKPLESFEAIIVDHYGARAYWDSAYTGANNPPLCSSRDLIHGESENCPSPNGLCANCPMAQFGTASNPDGSPGAGCACKEMHFIFTMRVEDNKIIDSLPSKLSIGPTSLKNFGNFLSKRVLMQNLIPEEAVIKIATEPAVSKGGINYRKATFEKTGLLDPESFAAMSSRIQGFRVATRRMAITSGDYQTEGTTSSPDLNKMDFTGNTYDVPQNGSSPM